MTEKDVVCGMNVDTKTALTLDHEGKAYYFCSEDCKRKFQSDPQKFTGMPSGHSHGGCC